MAFFKFREFYLYLASINILKMYNACFLKVTNYYKSKVRYIKKTEIWNTFGNLELLFLCIQNRELQYDYYFRYNAFHIDSGKE